MAFSANPDSVPVYMEVIQRILRHIAISDSGRGFKHGGCSQHLDAASLTGDQQRPMRLRLDLLQSFSRAFKKKAPERLLSLQSGNLTIFDLSNPFLDDATVCMLFETCLSIAKERRPRRGLVIELDKAHKCMNQSSAAANLTDRLLKTIREQRHNGTRVVISTEEPAISEKSSTSAPSILSINSYLPLDFRQSILTLEALREIIGLAVRESKVYVPGVSIHLSHNNQPSLLESDVLHMKTRRGIGVDGGVSIMVGETNGHAQQLSGNRVTTLPMIGSRSLLYRSSYLDGTEYKEQYAYNHYRSRM
ncbi:hypothetical protein D6D04_02947 [Aureobasidium pullulans]|nr:hypothetical protein D6D04_02947 [Aureobasidium pullulans]